jgi:hypothetical protein
VNDGRNIKNQVDSSWANMEFGDLDDAPSTLAGIGESAVTDEPDVDRKHKATEKEEDVVEKVEGFEEGDKCEEEKGPGTWCCPCFGF